MERIISKIAAMGVPGLVLVLAMNATGYAGAAAITTALAALGGPVGMLGGIAALGILGLISEAIAKYGVDAIYKGVIKELYKRGESDESIKAKIEKYPLSKEQKRILYDEFDKLRKKQEGKDGI